MEKIKAKGRQVVNEKTLIVTVDIGKTMNMGYCRCPDKTEVKPFEFQNGYQGFEKFLDVIGTTKRPRSWSTLLLALNLPVPMRNL